MLGKLIKHELKSSYRILFFIHGFMLMLALIMGIYLAFQSYATNDDYVSTIAFGLIAFFVAAAYGILVCAGLIGTQIYIAIRFYKNLFTDEGYLMHTLPVTPASLIHSKLIVGLIWTIFDITVVLLSLLILFSPYLTVAWGMTNINASFLSALSFGNGAAIASTILGFVYNMLMMFACICLGQLFNKHRGFTSVVIYGALSLFIQSLQSSIILSGGTVLNMAVTYLYTGSVSEVLSVLNIGLSLFIMYILPGLCFYLVCRYIVAKKINLQ